MGIDIVSLTISKQQEDNVFDSIHLSVSLNIDPVIMYSVLYCVLTQVKARPDKKNWTWLESRESEPACTFHFGLETMVWIEKLCVSSGLLASCIPWVYQWIYWIVFLVFVHQIIGLPWLISLDSHSDSD